MTKETTTKCGFVAVIGAPNAGKSSLVNAMVGAKVSIVTHKVQTTRARVRGVAVHGETQIVYIDTPGIFTPKRQFDRAMVAAAWDGLAGADAIVVMVDAPSYIAGRAPADGGAKRAAAAARRAAADTDAILEAIGAKGDAATLAPKTILAINKVDALPREKLLALTAQLNEHGLFSETYYISATRGDGLEDLRASLLARMPAGPWMYPEDQLSDISDRLLAAEITREKLYLRLHQELPYETTVETETWERTKKGGLRIEQTIYVARDSQKGIVLGRGGQTLKAIGAAAREELSGLLGETAHLFLFVKVRENWADDPARYREMGLEMGD
ncbi:MAG: GTPase Era [Pseudomonadota bacterium]